VPIPQGVDVKVDDHTVSVKGPLGALTRPIPSDITVAVEMGNVVVQRVAETRQLRALHGLVRNEIRNMIEGVTKGFEKVLEINGVGYKAALSGRTLTLNLGFTHPIAFPLPEGIEAKVDKQTVMTIRGRDRYLVGQTAANIRALKKPDVYKAKGVKYAGEILIRKEGKTGK
jgi:large subunit ribosomal protein L6